MVFKNVFLKIFLCFRFKCLLPLLLVRWRIILFFNDHRRSFDGASTRPFTIPYDTIHNINALVRYRCTRRMYLGIVIVSVFVTVLELGYLHYVQNRIGRRMHIGRRTYLPIETGAYSFLAAVYSPSRTDPREVINIVVLRVYVNVLCAITISAVKRVENGGWLWSIFKASHPWGRGERNRVNNNRTSHARTGYGLTTTNRVKRTVLPWHTYIVIMIIIIVVWYCSLYAHTVWK